ncbi:MAG: YfgM family protein [Vibrio sp.]
MAHYDAEEEQQVEAIKDWWHANGKAVIIGAVIGLGGIFGWRYYQDSVASAQEAASHSYTAVVAELAAKGADAEKDAQAFIDSNDKTSYAVLAAMQLAKVQIDAEKLDDALAQLKWAKEHNQDEVLAPMIDYRTARILAEKGDFDNAISAISGVKSEAWKARNQELMGDIYLLKGDKDAAIKAYTEAEQSGANNQTLQIKLDDLAK